MNAPHAAEFLTLQEIVAAARANLAPGPWNYLIGDSGRPARDLERISVVWRAAIRLTSARSATRAPRNL